LSRTSMSQVSDRVPESHRRQLGVTGPPGPELASHERRARNAHLAEFTRGRASERVAERGVASGLAHPAERDVGRKGPLVAREPERGQRHVDASGELDHLPCALRHPGPDDPRPAGRWEGAEAADSRLEGAGSQACLAQRAGDGVDPGLGDRAEEFEREVEIGGHDPGDVARGRAQPLDRLAELSADGVAEEDRDERANIGYRRISRSCSRLRTPCCRSGSASATSAARRSARAPSWSPRSSFSRPRAASARESSGRGSGARAAGTDATSCDGTCDGGPSDDGGAGARGGASGRVIAGSARSAVEAVGSAPAPGGGTGVASAGPLAIVGVLSYPAGATASIIALSPGSGSSSIARVQSARA